jgi:HK97 family phage portal protein
MGLLARIAEATRFVMMGAAAQSQSVGAEQGWIFSVLNGARTKAGTQVNQYTALNLPVVWSAVTLLVDVFTQLPVDMYQRTDRGSKKIVSHPVLDLLNAMGNDEMTSTSVLGAMEMADCTWGNGYAEIQWANSGEPVGLWPLLPFATRAESYLPDGTRKLNYLTSIDGKQFRLYPENVLHFKDYTRDGITGLSPIAYARQTIGWGLAMEEFGAKFFANDAKSGGFLMHPGKLGSKAITNIQDSMADQDKASSDGSGLDNAHRLKVLEEGLKYIPVTIPPEDAQFLGSREFQVAEVARIYHIPLVLLQSLEGSTVWGTGIESLLIAFVVFTIAPRLKRREQELMNKLLSPAERAKGFYLKFNLNALLRGDMGARSKFYQSGILSGWLVRNEAREKEDLNPIAGLDTPLQPQNTVGVDENGQAMPAAQQGSPSQRKSPPPAQDPAAEPEPDVIEEDTSQ